MAAMMTWVSPGSTIGIYLVELHRRACEAIGCRLAGEVEPLVGAAVQEDLDPVDVEQVGELDAYLEQSLAGGHGKKVAGDRRGADRASAARVTSRNGPVDMNRLPRSVA